MSVRKRTWKTASGEQRECWVADYTDQTGKRHVKAFKLKKEAYEAHDKVRTDIRTGAHVPVSGKQTVADLCQAWIKDIEAKGRERTTLAQYRQHVRLHINPRIGGVRVAKLTDEHLRKFRDDLLASMSRPMARKVMTSLHSVLKSAKRGHLLEGITIERSKRDKRPIEAGRDFPTPAEIKRMIEAASGPRERALLLTLALTGVRSSELRGLRWGDIDLRAGQLRIHQRVDCYGTVGAPKSATSVRSVPLDRGMLIPALKAWKIASPPGDLVFPFNHHQILRFLRPAVDKYGLHAFRHFFASWCLNPPERGGRGLPIKLVQTWLGHGSIVMTSDVYGHMLPARDDHRELDASTKVLFS